MAAAGGCHCDDHNAALLGLDALGAIAIRKEATLIALEGYPVTDVTSVTAAGAALSAC